MLSEASHKMSSTVQSLEKRLQSYSLSTIAEKVLLISVLVGSLFLNTVGTHWTSDEWWPMAGAVEMVHNGNFTVKNQGYPNLYFYFHFVNTVLFYVVGALKGVIIHPDQLNTDHFPDLYEWCRTANGMVGVLVVYLTYRFGKTLYDWRIGIAGAAIVATRSALVLQSHFVRPDVPLTLFCLAAALASAGGFKHTKNAFYAGLWFGLTTASKYNGFFFLIIGLSHCLLSSPRGSVRKHMLACTGGCFAAFFAASPNLFVYFTRFLDAVGVVGQLAHNTWEPAGTASPFATYGATSSFLRYNAFLLKEFGVVLLAGMLLSFFAGRRSGKAHYIMFAVSLAYYLSLGKQMNFGAHYLLPIFPYMSLFAALTLFKLADLAVARFAIPSKNLLYAVPIGLIAFLSFTPAFKQASFYRGTVQSPSSRSLASDWINENVRDGAKILMCDNVLAMKSPHTGQFGIIKDFHYDHDLPFVSDFKPVEDNRQPDIGILRPGSDCSVTYSRILKEFPTPAEGAGVQVVQISQNDVLVDTSASGFSRFRWRDFPKIAPKIYWGSSVILPYFFCVSSPTGPRDCSLVIGGSPRRDVGDGTNFYIFRQFTKYGGIEVMKRHESLRLSLQETNVSPANPRAIEEWVRWRTTTALGIPTDPGGQKAFLSALLDEVTPGEDTLIVISAEPHSSQSASYLREILTGFGATRGPQVGEGYIFVGTKGARPNEAIEVSGAPSATLSIWPDELHVF